MVFVQKEVGQPVGDDDERKQTKTSQLQEGECRLLDGDVLERNNPARDIKRQRIFWSTVDRAESESEVEFSKAKCDQLSTVLEAEKLLRREPSTKAEELLKDTKESQADETMVVEHLTSEGLEESGVKMTENQFEMISRLVDQVTALTVARDVLQRDKVTLTEELDQMKSDRERDNQTDDKKELETLQNRLQVLEDEVADQQTERHRHASEVLELKAQIETLETERDGMMSMMDVQTKENNGLKVEIHRLLQVISTERAGALAKPGTESEVMTKEALKNLARLIRDREFEIDALKQKNETLVCLLKESSDGGETVSTSLENVFVQRDELKMVIDRYQQEREQIVSALNQKHGESVAYHAEIQRMAGVIDQLRSGSQELVRQYELAQKQLLDARTATLAVDDHDPNKNLTVELERLSRNLLDKDKLLYEKDRQLHDKMHQMQGVGELLGRKEEEVTAARQHSEKLNEQLDGSHRDIDALRGSNDQLRARMEELRSSVATLKEANSMLSVTLQEREFELKALREKEDTLSRMVMKNEPDDDQDIRRLLSESEQMRQRAQGFQAERDQAILGLTQKQREADELREQIKGPCKAREERLLRELERLRDHLLHVEDSYTQEALRAEDREKELRTRLANSEDRVHTASSSHSTATHHATLQAESLQEQLRAVVEQRDEVLLSLSMVEDQLAQKKTALHTLQVVLEQLQQERQRDLTALQARHETQLNVERTKNEHFQQEIRSLVARQRETSEALDAASRLAEQLDRKEEIIRVLRQEVGIRDAEIEKTKQEIVRMNSSSEVTIDRTIVKNLVVGMLTVPSGQHKEVLRVIATILDFNKEERERTGLDQDVRNRPAKTSTTGWMSGWMSGKRSPHPATISGGQSQSLTEAFVRFLERESQPAVTVSNLIRPAVDSISEASKAATSHRAPRANPFNYPMVNHHSTLADSPPRLLTSTAFNTTGMGSSHLLLKPMSAALPTFASSVSVVAASDNVAFLRDALQDQ